MNFNFCSCTCDLEWFRLWIGNTHTDILDVEKYKCFSPPSMSKQPILSYVASRWKCDVIISRMALGLILVGITVFMVAVSTCIGFRWHVKFVCLVTEAHFLKYSPLQEHNTEYDFDASVSHSKHDVYWVTAKLQPELENSGSHRFRLCYWERDFLAGIELDKIEDYQEKQDNYLFYIRTLSGK
ncbi:toll-like receptor 6 [Saccoglossus kowalevskii]